MKRTRGKKSPPAEIGRHKSPGNTGSSWQPTDWQCIGMIVLLVAFFYRDILLGTAFFFDDFVYFNYPSRNFAATTMAGGSIPLWNPYTFGGMPFLADIQNAVFYVPYMTLTMLVRDGVLNFYWLELVTVLHVMLAGVSMFFLAKSFGLRRMPSLFAGAAFVFSGFLICRMVHVHVVALISWFPLILFLFRKILTNGGWLWVALTALVLGHSTLAGFPQLTFFIYLFLLLYFLFEFLTSYRGAAILSRGAVTIAVKAACAILLSVGIAAIQLLPTFELSSLSQRAQITYEMAVQGSLSWSQLLTLFSPKFFGTAGGNGYNYWGREPYWHYWETSIYLGAIPLMLALLATVFLRTNKYVTFFASISIFSFLYGLGDHFVVQPFLFEYLPGFNRFRVPARITLWLSLSVALLSGFTLDFLLDKNKASATVKRYRNLILFVAGGAVVLWISTLSGLLSNTFPFITNPPVWAILKREAAISCAIFVVSGIAVIVLVTHRVPATAMILILSGVFYVDALLYGGQQNNGTVHPGEYFSRGKPLVAHLHNEGKSEFFRVNTRNSEGMIIDRNQGMVDRIFMIEGFTPLVLDRVYPPLRSSDQLYDLLNVRYKTVTDTIQRRLSLVPHPTYLPRAFFLYQIKIVHSEEELLSYLKSEEFDHRTTAVLEKDPGFTLPPSVETPTWLALITAYENERILLDVETSHDGLLVLSEIFYPGWKAYVNGAETEILQTDYNLRSLYVPAGEHKVEVVFAPQSYATGATITLATLLACGMVSLFPLLRARKQKALSDDSP